MKLVKGQSTGYPFPPHSVISNAVVLTGDLRTTDLKSTRMALLVVTPNQMDSMRKTAEEKLKKEATGMPTAICIRWDSNRYVLDCYPTPSRDYDIAVRYAGPWQEI